MNNTTRLYAVPGAHNIIDTINDATGRTSINGDTFEQVLAREPLAVCLTWEEWRAQQIARQQTPITWDDTNEHKYREMLEVLPPAFWVGGLFLVGEAMDHAYATGQPRFTAYWHRRTSAGIFERYLVASRPITIAEARAIVAPGGQAVNDYGTGYDTPDPLPEECAPTCASRVPFGECTCGRIDRLAAEEEKNGL